MVVHELNGGGDSVTPGEDDAEWVVDADAAAAAKRALDVLEAVARGNSKVRLRVGGMKQIELSSSDRPELLRELAPTAAIDPVEDVARGCVGETLDHKRSLPLERVLCKRDSERRVTSVTPPDAAAPRRNSHRSARARSG